MASIDEKSGVIEARELPDEKKESTDSGSSELFDEPYVPDDSDEFIDPRLKDYPIPLVAKTGMLHSAPSMILLYGSRLLCHISNFCAKLTCNSGLAQ